MQKQILLQNKQVPYTLRQSRRVRRMRLAIYPDGSVILTAPRLLPESIVEGFLREKSAWVLDKLAYFLKRPRVKIEAADYYQSREMARQLISDRVQYFAAQYNFTYARISIRNQKRLWGSCSRKGNLNFNYKLMFIPEPLRDYVIVHELCHTREFNHSRKFWDLVGQILPEHRLLRKELRKYIK